MKLVLLLYYNYCMRPFISSPVAQLVSAWYLYDSSYVMPRSRVRASPGENILCRNWTKKYYYFYFIERNYNFLKCKIKLFQYIYLICAIRNNYSYVYKSSLYYNSRRVTYLCNFLIFIVANKGNTLLHSIYFMINVYSWLKHNVI